ncbi:MAG: prepilin-type N-terminal cleavage/methylation domain-containing protein [Planctomycetota bacterium]|nr:prepilin-type N-terminal cleavage/methylation domain-containing protein [Planctomycetota bacterium]
MRPTSVGSTPSRPVRSARTPRRKPMIEACCTARIDARGSRPPRLQRPAARRAFSLVELVLVVSLIGLLAAIALPRYGKALSRYRVDAAAVRVSRDLSYAASIAQASSSTARISFDTGRSAYRVEAPGAARARASYEVLLGAGEYQVELVAVSFADAPEVRFNGFGVASANGSIVLLSGDEAREIIFDAHSNVVAIERMEYRDAILRRPPVGAQAGPPTAG